MSLIKEYLKCSICNKPLQNGSTEENGTKFECSDCSYEVTFPYSDEEE